ncbi:MAG: hypothetical protein JRG96_04165 [Deltaproteobacteria bacterium]|nr:hypothetical protein [Deltaproteobacteria bacterium]MBW2417459.1 hypothetical protein [Deltaproteobacteria bacterium]
MSKNEMSKNRTSRSRVVLSSLIALSVALVPGCSDPSAPEPEKLRETVESIEWRARANELYELLRVRGEEAPGEVSDWAQEDLESIGAWEYKVEPFPPGDPAAIEARMNELGAERWECFSVTPSPTGPVLLFRRPVRSYLGSIPLMELLRLLALGGALSSG